VQNALEKLDSPEIFIGLVSPVGVETSGVISSISRFFISSGYDVFDIKVTDYFDILKKSLYIDLPLTKKPIDRRIFSYIDFGNKIREEFNDDSVLAAHAVFRIAKIREREFKKKQQISYQKRVYIIHQFKRKEEIDLMRSVYGRLFFQISIYSSKKSRIDYLSHRIAHDRGTADQSESRSIAHDLVARDENEKKNLHGQRLTKIFHDADFIVNCDAVEHDGADKQVTRFLELIFSSNSISPTKLEYGMFAAKAAALRTLDLSRQVGAAIFRSSGEVISLGSNEVPKAGGGTYWCDEAPYDAREYTIGFDSNDGRKREILAEIFAAAESPLSFDEFAKKEAVRESQFMDALEYGRIVHAEMSAISDAARLGLSVADATLFCTTFPCHMCAKHIVSAGLKKVVFLEPYPKSLAGDLHSDSIQIEGASRGRYETYEAVKFEHFHGVTPRRYRELFERGSRKSDGQFEPYIRDRKRPNLSLIAPFYTDFEAKVVRSGFAAFEEIVVRKAAASENQKKFNAPR